MDEKKTKKPYYINNKEFSLAVMEYATQRKAATEAGETPPKVTDYIAQCFLNIANGLGHKSNFSRYTFREEMIMDAVENMLKAIANYNIDTKTRTGTPNAFSYFTQISWYAFLRRIAKEKGQVELKNKFLRSAQVGDFLLNNTDTNSVEHRVAYQYFVDTLREKIDNVKETDAAFKEFKDAKKKKKKVKAVDSDLSDFIGEGE